MGFTLKHVHIDTRVTSTPIKSLQSFARLERLRIARCDLVLSSQDRADNGERMDNDQRDYLGASNDGDDDKMDGDDEMNWVDERDGGDERGEDDETDGDDGNYVHLECDPFLDKLPPSLQLMRIDRADRAILKELTTIPTAIRNSLPKLEKLELQSHNQRLLKAAVDAVQYSGAVVELAGCRNDCWNCDAASTGWVCNSGCS
jgi:hypothetical protein